MVRSLRAVGEGELPAEARKLLTFVDNRQDASLQAGHFNDFVQVTQLRGALYRAARQEQDGLTHEEVAQQVADALGLDFADYASNPEAKFSQRKNTERAFREVLAYRLYADLQRGWRVTMPNLEQVGLLRVGYVDLPDIAEDDSSWEGTHHALRDAAPGLREELGRIVLDELRRVLAIDVDALTPEGFDKLKERSRRQLVGPWALGDNEPEPRAGTAFARSGKAGASRNDLNLSSRSALGRYLQQPGRFPRTAGKIDRDDAQKIISDLLRTLERLGLLRVVVPAEVSGAPGYRLKASAILWRAGDGTRGAEDPLRRIVDPDAGARVNPFFLELYRDVAQSLTGLHAREHTAQVPSEDRSAARRSSARVASRCCTAHRQWSSGSTSRASTRSRCATSLRPPRTTRSAAVVPAGPVSRPSSSRTAPPATVTTSTTSAGPGTWSPGRSRPRAST